MPEIVIRLPDIGEGIAEAEITEWPVGVGEWVEEDEALVVVLTDKAAVEIPSSVSGTLLWQAAEPGAMLAVGAPLVRIEVADDGASEAEKPVTVAEQPERGSEPEQENTPPLPPKGGRTLAAPAVRKRAGDLGVDLAAVGGTGPDGRVTHADLDQHIAGRIREPGVDSGDSVTETRIIGLRRRIAEQMTVSHTRIPQITIIEEVDVSELERLRAQMNADQNEATPRLTMLPFLIAGLVAARASAPQVNARFEDDAGILRQYGAVHCGIATQTKRGLVVPVLRNAQARPVRELAAEITRLAAGARDGLLGREEFSGATITVTSLGPLGAVATTPLVSHPQVAIVGVNRRQVRPVWDGTGFAPREMMNLSASFDHRIVDGWDAANFVARLKTLYGRLKTIT